MDSSTIQDKATSSIGTSAQLAKGEGVKQKPWEVLLTVQSIGAYYGWEASNDKIILSSCHNDGKYYLSQRSAFTVARRVLKRLGLVERKAKAGKAD